jgi:RPA family protein
MSDAGAVGNREVAYRLFATAYDDADFEYSESDEERAPNYVITPTGGRVNRVFVVGVLTEVESVSDDVLRARVVDPTGAFVCYAGQYQPDEQAFLDRADPPTFVAMTGKARTFQPDDGDRVFTSVRPEAINEVDADTRDRWTVQAAEQTLERIRTIGGALALDLEGDDLREALLANGVAEGLAAGIPLAREHYGTGAAYLDALADVALDAARLIAGEVDEVDAATVAPDSPDGSLDLAVRSFEVPDDVALEADAASADDAGAASETASAGSEAASVSDTSTDSVAAEAPGDEGDPVSTDSAPDATSGVRAGDESAGVDTEPEVAGSGETAVEPGDSDDPGDFEPGEFDLEETQRAEIESEYGTEFQSGTEVEEPGEADIDTPGPADESPADAAGEAGAAGATSEPVEPDETVESTAEATTAGGATEAGDAAGDPDSDAGTSDGEDADATVDEDADLEDVVVDVMEELSDGSGAGRAAVVETVMDRTGADESAVDDAIQDALMDGRCYEPEDDTFQPI